MRSLTLIGLLLAGCPGGGGGTADMAHDAATGSDAGRDATVGDAQAVDGAAGDGAGGAGGAGGGGLDGARPDAGPIDATADSAAPDGGLPNCPAAVADVDPEQLDELTAAFAFAGHLDGARCAAERLYALFPDHPLAINNLAFVLLESGALDDALALLRPAAAAWPDAAPILQNLALAASRAGNHPEALEAADALVELEPDEDCTALVTRMQVAVRAGRVDVDEARRLILGRCHQRVTWQRLVDEGLVPPAPPQHLCIDMVGVPDRRSTCPRGDRCQDPVVFPVPDCTALPGVCAADPAWRNYNFGEQALPIFGVITGSWILAASVDFNEVSCEGETECFPVPPLPVERSVSVNVAGPTVIQPSLTLPMVNEGPLSAAGFWVVFPLFPQRVIHPSAMGAEVGCPGARGPFYHFDGQDDFDEAVDETVRRLEALDGFQVNARASVVGMAANYASDNGWWAGQACPQPPFLQCQDAQVSGGGNMGPPAVPATCAEPLARALEAFDIGSVQTLAFMDIRSSSVMCDLPGPGVEEGFPAELARAALSSLLPEGSAEVVLFRSPGGVLELSLNHKGELTTGLAAGMFSLDGSVGLLDSGFEIRAGVGAPLPGNALADFEIKAGIGIKGDRGKRSIDSVFGFATAEGCVAEQLKFGIDRAVDVPVLTRLAQDLNRRFLGGPGRQVALSSR